jgi:hypothetical protein
MKRALLEQEGIGFYTSGRVQVDSFFYSSPLDNSLTVR